MFWAGLIAFLAAAIAALGFLNRQNDSSKKLREKKDSSATVVLGLELKNARENENTRLATGDAGPSPMPGGEYTKADYNFYNVEPVSLDGELRAFVTHFRNLSLDERNSVRASISMDEFYTLIGFAKRSAVLALNAQAIDHLEAGLTALAIIDKQRIDYRDAHMAMGLLRHASDAMHVDKQALVEDAKALATPGIAEIIHLMYDSGKLASYGYVEVNARNGKRGLIHTSYDRYEPTFDMTQLAIDLGHLLDNDLFRTSDIRLASFLPAFHFIEDRKDDVKKLMKQALAGFQVTTKMREEYLEEEDRKALIPPYLNLWVLELLNSQDVHVLESYLLPPQLGSEPSKIGILSGPIFALLTADKGFSNTIPVSPAKLRVLADEIKDLMDAR